MDFDKPPTLKEFAEVFNRYLEYIGCMDNEQGYMGSHNIVSEIRVYDIDEDDDTAYEIVGIDFEQLGGCGCESDITIKIKKAEQ